MISVFTPTHDPRYLSFTYDSLRKQTFKDWEWVIVENGDAQLSRTHPAISHDPKVTVVHAPNLKGIGLLKYTAVQNCKGDLLVELDHDDELEPDALARLNTEYQKHTGQAGAPSMYYSRFTQIDQFGQPNRDEFSASHGWKYDDINGFLIPKNPAPTPHNVSFIWYAPNHLRAFPRWAYDRAGGYNPLLEVCDDQDLMCRLFQVGYFYEVAPEKFLYKQRVHGENTQVQRQVNDKIQATNVQLYEKYIQEMLLAWSKRNGLEALDLGCGNTKPDGYFGIDLPGNPDADFILDIERDGLAGFKDNSAGVVRAVDFLEHIRGSQKLMNEIWRVLAPGGVLLSMTPSTDGRGAFQDPTHVSFWNSNSFWYYTDDKFRDVSPQHKDNSAKFQVSSLKNFFPSDFHVQNNIPYVQANLIAIKPGTPRQGGILNVSTD